MYTNMPLNHDTTVPASNPLYVSSLWPPPNTSSSGAGKIRVPNLSAQLHVLKQHEHLCQVRPVLLSMTLKARYCFFPNSPNPCHFRSQSSNIHLDPDKQLSPEMTSKFHALIHHDFNKVFDSQTECYNIMVTRTHSKWQSTWVLLSKWRCIIHMLPPSPQKTSLKTWARSQTHSTTHIRLSSSSKTSSSGIFFYHSPKCCCGYIAEKQYDSCHRFEESCCWHGSSEPEVKINSHMCVEDAQDCPTSMLAMC